MSSKSLADVVLLMGPTASGKTALSIELAKSLDAEIISVDSALVYRGMDIGTAKPDMQERQGIKHHLIDILDPSEVFSAGQFKDQALSLIDQIQQNGKRVVLVGGTMLYFHVLLQGMAKLRMQTPLSVKTLMSRRSMKAGLPCISAWQLLIQ